MWEEVQSVTAFQVSYMCCTLFDDSFYILCGSLTKFEHFSIWH